MKRKLAKLLCAACTFCMLSGTVVMAYSYDFSIPAGGSRMTEVHVKQSDGSAYVDRTGPATDHDTVLTVNMCNRNGVQKSDQRKINGIGHAYPSYYGYGVDAGDSIALMGTNEVPQNGGRSIRATGTYTP